MASTSPSDPSLDPPFPEALGQSEAFLDFQERLSRVARVERPVLLIGERGTGKELAARRLHYLSLRWEEPAGRTQLLGACAGPDRVGVVWP